MQQANNRRTTADSDKAHRGAAGLEAAVRDARGVVVTGSGGVRHVGEQDGGGGAAGGLARRQRGGGGGGSGVVGGKLSVGDGGALVRRTGGGVSSSQSSGSRSDELRGGV